MKMMENRRSQHQIKHRFKALVKMNKVIDRKEENVEKQSNCNEELEKGIKLDFMVEFSQNEGLNFESRSPIFFHSEQQSES